VNAELRTTVASQSEALKTARTTLHNQRADIDRLRTALETTGATGLRGLGKADARTVAEVQRLTASLSKAQEDLERARTSAEENLHLRRELSRLASQILSVARTQGAPQVQQRMVVEVAQAFTQYNAIPETPEELEPPEEEQHPPHSGNGAVHAPELAETTAEPDRVAAGMARAAAYAEVQAPAEEAPEEAKASFAQRFVARREARRARKGEATSLGDRLRGLVADRS
jgi:hypothetical protein